MFAPRARTELRRLLDAADLDHAVPSTLWDRTDEGTWRTGLAGSATQPPWQAAAHEAGSVTAWRSFTSEEGDEVTLQVVPLAADSDAAEALAAVTDPTIGFRTAPRAHPAPLVVADTTGAYLVVAEASGPGWTRHDVAEIVAAQLTKLR